MEFLGFCLRSNLFLAPMAGITDLPYRILCRQMGAGLAASEMVTSNSLLYGSEKTLRRATHTGEEAPVVVQIAGANPDMMAQAARYNVDQGAQIIDINMGCPAKKVCNVMAGSALLQDETLVAQILSAVVRAVPQTPVTLKIRTGWNRAQRNALRIARIAEQCGIRALAVHGRTRADFYSGEAEYDTIAQIKHSIHIPVIANGDIDSPHKARAVLEATHADALMIGRAAQGCPWIFHDIQHFLQTGEILPPPTAAQIHAICLTHMNELYKFYGEQRGVRIARKHIAWYTRGLSGSAAFRREMNTHNDIHAQRQSVDLFFNTLPTPSRASDNASKNAQELAA